MANEKSSAFTVDQAIAGLTDFLADNPLAEVVENTVAGKTIPRIINPWGDPSVSIDLDEDFEGLASTLNGLILPPRLSAIWHKATKRLEVIWTAYELVPSQKEIAGRSFEFQKDGVNYQCSFSEASDELVTLAKSVIPVGMSVTNHRNIYSFAMHARNKSGKNKKLKTEPRSFWIDGLTYHDEEMIDLINNLNFYITYFDVLSPYVVVHPPKAEKIPSNKARYKGDSFPKVITSAKLDENLLSFWESAQGASPFMAFLLYFRIIEYAAYHYVEESARASISRIIRAPDLIGNVSGSVDGIISALASTQKLHDSQRIRLIIKKCVLPGVLWPDIRDNQEFFSRPTCFDGGFSVEGVVGAKDREENWGGHRLDNVADAFRKIRNALSHGKDQETTGVIRPTQHNINLFRPWVHLINAAAGEVVLYKDTP